MTLNEFLNHHAIDIEPDLESREWQRNGAFYLRIWSTTLNEEAIVEAVAGDWSESRQVFWRSTDNLEKLNELSEARAGVDQELKVQRLANQERVAGQAEAFFLELTGEVRGVTPYLKRKGIPNVFGGARIRGEDIFVKAHDIDGKIWGYQRILPEKKEGENDKWFLKGMRTQGMHCLLGEIPKSLLYIAEGYATACSIHLATSAPTACAFNAGNLESVASEYRRRYPNLTIIICGDDDRWNKENTGRLKATEAARKAKAEARFPAFKSLDGKPTDFNDLHIRETLDEVKRQLTPSPQKKTNDFCFLTLEELFQKPPEKHNWLADGILAKGGTSMLAGKPKSGKTTLSRCLALAIAEGAEFLGRKTIQGPVLYVAVEEKESEVIKLFRRLEASAEAAKNIRVHASVAPINGLEKLKPFILKFKPELVILDTLFKIVRIENENNYAEVSAALEPINTLARETGCHIMCLHHMGKVAREGADGILGSTAIAGLFDTNLMLSRNEDRRTLKSQQRYGRELEETVLEFDAGRGAISLGRTRRDDDAEQVGDEIMEVLRGRKEPASETEIGEILGGNKNRRQRAIRLLCLSARIVRSGEGTRKDPFKYCVNGDGTGVRVDQSAVKNAF